MRAYVWSPQDIEKIRTMRESGASWEDIAQTFAVRRETIRALALRHGIHRVEENKPWLFQPAPASEPQRADFGDAPLPPMHPLSWAVINPPCAFPAELGE